MAKQKKTTKHKETFTVKVPAANRNYKTPFFGCYFPTVRTCFTYNAVNQRDYKNPDDLNRHIRKNALIWV